jgi:hypothetical protein
MKRKTIIGFVLVLAVLCLVGCGGGGGSDAPAELNLNSEHTHEGLTFGINADWNISEIYGTLNLSGEGIGRLSINPPEVASVYAMGEDNPTPVTALESAVQTMSGGEMTFGDVEATEINGNSAAIVTVSTDDYSGEVVSMQFSDGAFVVVYSMARPGQAVALAETMTYTAP